MIRRARLRMLITMTIAGALAVLLQACSPATVSPTAGVAEAYETSGLIALPPYNRTIFSSTNF